MNADGVNGANGNALIDKDLEGDQFESGQMPQNNYEAPPVICKRLESSNEFLRIENLQKVFSGGFRAVNGVNVKMYDS